MKIGLPSAALLLLCGCWSAPDGAAPSAALSESEGWRLAAENLLAVRADQRREELAREFQTMALRQRLPERAAALERNPEDAAARAEARQALETAVGIAVQLMTPDDAAAARLLTARVREELGREYAVPARRLPVLERELAEASAAGVPETTSARLRAARDDAAMRLRTLTGLAEGEGLELTPDPAFAPVLPPEAEDGTIAFRCRPELAEYTGPAAALAAAVRYLESQLPPVSADPDGAAASLRAAQAILRLPDELSRRRRYDRTVPEETRFLLAAWGIAHQLRLDRRDVAAGADGAAEQLRCDLGLEPGEAWPEPGPAAEASPELKAAAKTLLQLMTP